MSEHPNKRAFTNEVAKLAQEYGDKLHVDSTSYVVGRKLNQGDSTFIVTEADKARLLAVHQAFAAMVVRWRHHLLVCGVPESIVKANELQGVAIGAQSNSHDDMLNNKSKIVVE